MNSILRSSFVIILLGIIVAACAPPPVSPTTAIEPSSSATAAAPESTAPPAATVPETPAPAQQGMADVVFVKAVQSADGTWRFSVTVSHPDTGWEDYADGWDVVTPDGQTLKVNPDDPFTRLLLHPHVGEQSFTRSQGRIRIPGGVTRVTVRAHSLTRGFGGREVVLDLTQASGEGFEVQRALPLATPEN